MLEPNLMPGMMLQGYVLPTLSLMCYLKRDGSYYSNPWLVQSDPTPQEIDSRRRQTSDQAHQPSPLDSQPSSEPDPQQLLAAASARLSQRSAAELANATPSQDATSVDATLADATSQQTQSLSASVEELQAHQYWQESLVQAAAALASDSPFPVSRHQAMAWLVNLVPQLTEQGCTALDNSGAVTASVNVIQQESEHIDTRVAAVEFCLRMLNRDALPVAALLEAGVHQHLTQLMVHSGQPNVYSRVRETMFYLFSHPLLVRSHSKWAMYTCNQLRQAKSGIARHSLFCPGCLVQCNYKSRFVGHA